MNHNGDGLHETTDHYLVVYLMARHNIRYSRITLNEKDAGICRFIYDEAIPNEVINAWISGDGDIVKRAIDTHKAVHNAMYRVRGATPIGAT